MLPERHISIDEFVRRGLSLSGAAFSEDEGILEALFPESEDLIRATREPEIAREEADVELLGHGSQMVAELVRRFESRPVVAQAWILPPHFTTPAIGRSFELQADSITFDPPTERTRNLWIFVMRSRIEGEFRRDMLHRCAIDAASLRFVRRFEERVAAATLMDEGPAPVDSRPFADCWQRAKTSALDDAEIAFRSAMRDAQKELHRDIALTRTYYDGLIAEMTNDARRRVDDSTRAEGIDARIRTTAAERDRLLAQAVERHQLELSTDLVAVTGVAWPRSISRFQLRTKSGVAAEFDAVYDPLLENFDPLTCPLCLQPTYRLQVLGRVVSCGCASVAAGVPRQNERRSDRGTR